MESIFRDFGIQPVLLAAQVVNFLVLLYILKRFLYKPILKTLSDRRKTIEESLKNAAEIEKRLQETEDERLKKLEIATKEAQALINEASSQATQIVQEAKVKASDEVSDMIQKAQETIKLEQEMMRQELRVEMAGLIALSLQKITGKILTKKDQEKLVGDSLKEIKI